MKSSHKTMASTKAIASFFILLVAFGIFLVFQNYQDTLSGSNSLKLFVAMSIIAGGFLLGLLYLVSKSSHVEPALSKKAMHATRTKKRSKSRKK